MREYKNKTENKSHHTFQRKSKAANQTPVSEILQAYRDKMPENKSIQRESIEDEELLQIKTSAHSSVNGTIQQYRENIQRYLPEEDDEVIQSKSDIIQREGMEDEEIWQGKSENVPSMEKNPVQREVEPNNAGLPDNLKTGIENLSGYNMDDVKVHYNSDKPAQLQALAFAQGTDIHVAPGQEKHLPHEAWHVVQQKQGRVEPTTQMQGINVNDNKGLEKEADMMGKRIKEPIQKNTFISYKTKRNSIESVQLVRNVKNLQLIAERRLKKIYKRLTGVNPPQNFQHIIPFVSQDILHGNNNYGLPQNIVQNVNQNIQQANQTILNYINNIQNNPLSSDLNHAQNGFNNNLGDPNTQNSTLWILRNSLNNILFPNNQYIFPPGNYFFESDKGFELASRIMPTVAGNDYTKGYRLFGGSTSDNNHIEYGLGTGPNQIVHEVGHVLENKMGIEEYIHVHRFLRARTRNNQMSVNAGWRRMSTGDAYNAYLPALNIFTQNYGNPPVNSPINMGLYKLSGGQQKLDRAFAEGSNSEAISYATMINSNYDDNGEFISTTAELFASAENAHQLIDNDPLRAAFFLYMANRPIYNQVSNDFQQNQPQVNLDNLIHA